MFDFNQGAGSGGNYDRGEYNQDKASSQLNLANLILVDLVYLIKNGATLETKLTLVLTSILSLHCLFDILDVVRER